MKQEDNTAGCSPHLQCTFKNATYAELLAVHLGLGAIGGLVDRPDGRRALLKVDEAVIPHLGGVSGVLEEDDVADLHRPRKGGREGS